MKARVETAPNDRPRTARKAPEPGNQAETQWHALLGQQNLLEEKIRQGRECLAHAQAKLAESQSRLEDWPVFEQKCGNNCLPWLTESVCENQRVEQFLAKWLERREHELAEIQALLSRVPIPPGVSEIRCAA